MRSKFAVRHDEPADEGGSYASAFLEAQGLPEDQRRALCEGLLEEFGISNWSTNRQKGELIHSCSLPGHDDSHPSAALNYKILTYSCFSCGRSGGFLWYVATCRGQDATEAFAWLQEQTGLGGQVMDLQAVLDVIRAAFNRHDAPEVIPRYPASTLEPWLDWETIHPYWTDAPARYDDVDPPRGIPEANARHFQLGYAPDYEMRTGAGIVRQERVIVPHFWRGNLVGWQARRLMKRDKPKFKSNPGFPADQTLFNHDPSRRRVVVVEAPLSVVRHHHHIPDMAGTFGAQVTPAQLRHLARHDQVVIWFDPDNGGFEGTRQITDGISHSTDVRVVRSVFSADPAEFSDDHAEEMVDGAVPWPLWKVPTRLKELR